MSEKEVFHDRPQGRSLFGPILLIALGVFFLLSNLGLVPSLNWAGVFQLWPLILIFIGVNILARGAPGRLGTLLSGLVALTAVTIFGYVLLFGEDNPWLSRLGVSSNIELIREDIVFAAADVQAATVHIDLDAADAEITALSDSQNLIEGSVTYTGDLIFETEAAGNRADIFLDTRDNRFPFWGMGGFGFSEEDDWRLGLSPDVATELTIDAGSGRLLLDLAGLNLSALNLDSGSGRSELILPGGEFEVEMDSGSGSSEVTLAGDGRYRLNFKGGSGSLTLYLPATTTARIEFEGGSGRLVVDERFRRVSGDEKNGVWETAGMDSADSFADMTIEVGSGSVQVKSVSGR